jgi:hypothetical protein
MRAPLAMLLLVLLPASCGILWPLQAQHHHGAGHEFYQNWINGKDQGCCNNQDCGKLADEDEREVGGQVQVRVKGEWCPVKPHHYLKKGNAPNWQTAHVCVLRPLVGEDGEKDFRSPCDRFVCYQPKPLF